MVPLGGRGRGGGPTPPKESGECGTGTRQGGYGPCIVVCVRGGGPPAGKEPMPTTPEVTPEEVTLDSLTPEARAVLMAEARAMVTGTVVTAAQHRHASEPGMVGVSLRQPLSPHATAEDRRRNIATALREAGILAEGFTPSPIEGVTLTPGQIRCLTLMAQGHGYRTGAEAAFLNVSTFKKHLGLAYRRLGVNALPEAVIAAVRLGILPLSAVVPPEATPEATPSPTVRARCSAEGCRKRTSHASGLCPDHRE